FFSSRRRHTRWPRDWSSDVCSSDLLSMSATNKSITVYGDGSQTRSFCYVDDLIDGLVALMESSDDLTGPVNLGNPAEFTILELEIGRASCRERGEFAVVGGA